ncbi:MAG TPA: hypothetical protein VFM42_01540 [Sphingomicrobium sp.]|nr:hypothetical protein [Sphingomicrobium sp.]
MKTSIFILIALGAGSIGWRDAAQSANSKPRPPDLTRQQARERADQRFDQFDLNHDGVVTRGEAVRLGGRLMLLRATTGIDAAPGIGGHTLRFIERRFARLDAVNKRQAEQALLAHFDDMDTNRDRVLTAAERLRAG